MVDKFRIYENNFFTRIIATREARKILKNLNFKRLFWECPASEQYSLDNQLRVDLRLETYLSGYSSISIIINEEENLNQEGLKKFNELRKELSAWCRKYNTSSQNISQEEKSAQGGRLSIYDSEGALSLGLEGAVSEIKNE